jgi:hypothetical protein
MPWLVILTALATVHVAAGALHLLLYLHHDPRPTRTNLTSIPLRP